MARRLRMAMIGGGPGAFIGAVHRMAAQMDGQIELVAGAFSSDAERSRSMADELCIPKERCYASYAEMLAPGGELASDEGCDFVSIVTPNHVHAPAMLAALDAGLPVICDKPMTMDVAEAQQVLEKSQEKDLPVAVTYNYTGYPMVRELKTRIESGDLGAIRKVEVQYPQGWLAKRIEDDGQKQASWRTDPERAGAAGCLGDIGTHAANLAEFTTGLQIEEVCADLHTFVDGRQLDDDAGVLLRLSDGARGVLWASQVCVGEENALSLRVYGEQGGAVWRQEEPNTLVLTHLDRAKEVLRTAGPGLGEAAEQGTRLPAGHPEGFLEGFANLYRDFASVVRAWQEGKTAPPSSRFLPTAREGLRGMQFIEASITSSARRQWTHLAK